jgi:glycerophosphoryl diester phosphodiesterase
LINTGSFGFDGPVEIIAHRGFSAQAPENTFAALELAIEAGADAVEFDIQLASDGSAFLMHDTTLDRTTNGHGPVSSCAPEAITRLDAGSWFSEAYSGEPVPPLPSAMLQIAGRIGRIYLEVKRFSNSDDLDRVVEAVDAANARSRTVFISMDWDALAHIRTAAKDALIGYIVDDASRTADGVERARGDDRALLDFDAKLLLGDPDLAGTIRDYDIPMAAWTVNTTDDADKLLRMGVPRLTTNEVSDLMDWKKRL